MTAVPMTMIDPHLEVKTAARMFLRIPPADFDLDAIFDCGQCFRWEKRPDGAWHGVARGRALTVRRQGARLYMEGAASTEARGLWRPYFDLGRDYGAVKTALSHDPVLRRAVGFAPGIRILRQEPWEALASFILSQNNNIPRIRGLVARLCTRFGEALGGGDYAFPTPGRLAEISPAELRQIGCGYRAEYLAGAARAVASGRLRLGALSRLPLETARERLLAVHGVGPKVADCVLLFGCGRLDCFPRDVWIRRALAALYPGGFPAELAPFAGIAQQYLFHYVRGCPQELSGHDSPAVDGRGRKAE